MRERVEGYLFFGVSFSLLTAAPPIACGTRRDLPMDDMRAQHLDSSEHDSPQPSRDGRPGGAASAHSRQLVAPSGQAQSVLFSRDPHLAAIGFIFTPLASMMQIPAIALSPIWPDMAARAFSGTIMSALFMAGAA